MVNNHIVHFIVQLLHCLSGGAWNGDNNFRCTVFLPRESVQAW
jgi:hypothetical protein